MEPKLSYNKGLGPVDAAKSGQGRTIAEDSATLSQGLARWPKRPRIIQLNAGRVEMSMPWQIAIAMLLGVVLLILVVFRLGQFSEHRTADFPVETPKSAQERAGQATAGITQEAATAQKMALNTEKAEPAKTQGNNRIVIQTFQIREHLEPVKDYFAGFGIETEIKKVGDWYYLVTADKYDNPERQGTDGYLVKQRIIELGANYKAPAGYETFGKKPFQTAFGKRFDD